MVPWFVVMSRLDLNRTPTPETRAKEFFFILCKFYFDCFHQATPQKLISHVVADHSAIDPTYVEDLLLTYKTFLDRPSQICSQLLNWFLERRFRDKVRFLFFPHLRLDSLFHWLTLDWLSLDWLTFDRLTLDWLTLDWLAPTWFLLDWLTFDWLTLDWLLIAGDARNASLGQ